MIRSGQLAPRSFAPGNNRIQVESNLFVETDRRSSIQPQPRQLQQPPPQPRQFRQPRPRAPQPVARARSRPRAQSPPCDLLCAIARIFGLWIRVSSFFKSFYSFLIHTVNAWINRILLISSAAEFNLFMHALDLKISIFSRVAIWDCNSIWDLGFYIQHQHPHVSHGFCKVWPLSRMWFSQWHRIFRLNLELGYWNESANLSGKSTYSWID